MKLKKVLLMATACFAIASFTACQTEPSTTDGMIIPTSEAEATSTPIPTSAPTVTDVPTETPEPTATSTPTPSSEPTTTSTPTPTNTPTPTPSPSPEPTATSTPSPTPTATSTPTPTPSPEPTPTATPTPSPEPTATATPTPSPSPEPTITSIPKPSPTAEPTSQVLKADSCPHGHDLHAYSDHKNCGDNFIGYDGNLEHVICIECDMVFECYDGTNVITATGNTKLFSWYVKESEPTPIPSPEPTATPTPKPKPTATEMSKLDGLVLKADTCSHGDELHIYYYTSHKKCGNKYSIYYIGDGCQHVECSTCGMLFECYNGTYITSPVNHPQLIGDVLEYDHDNPPKWNLSNRHREVSTAWKDEKDVYSDVWNNVIENLLETGKAIECNNYLQMDYWTYWNGNKDSDDTRTTLFTDILSLNTHTWDGINYLPLYDMQLSQAFSPGAVRLFSNPNIVIGILNKATGEFVFSTSCNDNHYRENDGRKTVSNIKFANGDSGVMNSIIENSYYFRKNPVYSTNLVSSRQTYYCEFRIQFDVLVNPQDYTFFVTSCDMETWLANEDWYYENSYTVVDDFYGNIDRMWTEGADIIFWELIKPEIVPKQYSDQFQEIKDSWN